MSITTHKNTLKRLTKINSEQSPSEYISVVYMDENGDVEWPENPNSKGVLAVPKSMTLDAWERNKTKKAVLV